MAERVTIKTRITTTHRIDAYGGYKHPEGLLEKVAEAVRSGTLPLTFNHDHTRDVDARCLSASIVDLDDGHRAVDAAFDVDADQWAQWDAERMAMGAPGGMSFTWAMYFSEFASGRPDAHARLALVADAAHFSDESIEAAAEKLGPLGVTRAGRLYQFAAAPDCRVVVEYVHASGGLEGATMVISVGLSMAANALYDALSTLLKRRRVEPTLPQHPAKIEVQITTTPGGPAVRRMHLTTDEDAVIRRAIDRAADALEQPGDRFVWHDDRGLWLPPE